MELSNIQILITIGLIILATMITRFLPFFVFPENKKTPKYILYLGDVLPYAVIGLLVVYCLRETTVVDYPYFVPEFVAILLITVLHLWKKNTLISIGFGTMAYMVLVQFVFK